MSPTRIAKILSFAAVASSLAAAADPRVLSVDFTKTSKPSSYSKRGLGRRDTGAYSFPINSDGNLYYINMTIGTPPQHLAVYVDSGSSDLWLPDTGSDSDFCQTTQYGCGDLGGFSPSDSSTFKVLENMGEFAIEYGDGTEIEGEYFTDNVAFGRIRLSNVTMAVALKGSTEYPVNGIMGVGYIVNEAPTEQEVETKMLTPYPNIISELKDQGIINTLAYSIYLNDRNAEQGTILFGGVDKAKYTGDLIVVPIQPDPAYTSLYGSGSSGSSGSSSGSGSGSMISKAKKRQDSGSSSTPNPVYDAFWVSLTGVGFSNSSGSNDISMGSSDSYPVLLDSGTSIMYVPGDIADSLYDQLGVTMSQTYGPLLRCSGVEGDLSFTFGSGGPTVKVPLQQLLLEYPPHEGPTYSDGTPACLFGLMSGDDTSSGSGSGDASGQAPTYVLGDTFLTSAYVVFDMTNNQVGLAQANPNATSSDIVEISSTIPGDSTVGSASSVTATPSGVVRTTRRAPQVTSNAQVDETLSAIAEPTLAVTSGSGTGSSSMSGPGIGSDPAGIATSATPVNGASSTATVPAFSSAAAPAGNVGSKARVSSIIAASVAIAVTMLSGGVFVSWM